MARPAEQRDGDRERAAPAAVQADDDEPAAEEHGAGGPDHERGREEFGDDRFDVTDVEDEDAGDDGDEGAEDARVRSRAGVVMAVSP
ncbi:hypothetical protein [Phytomonospora endophytica]|uniref:Uncharacterized protein n=1 Tax=Phytomonospora endophytica TaxID=714109 RepID=A0A841FMC4_9ACTN|nr:hypothetical protein [Phytomonospora endophytica]MBB6037286.1 hypothetical protein [Phytomonospora endophytica]GIG69970.1 hypothetical protein Pen01_62650 [Phytomonospora endophytica]